ncbi:putative imidazolonepropionase-like protein [Blastocystis sp. subtype 4]|uniref:putative imidazolonepropionase-like protein n=1 Tax=Blastocystis sp. subtype 4 TaxID=944170 RepID=UPI0007116BB8|nr:putative imidazolonepropionase-like protein [Blastocystis sp. subtype 4]KNB42249.1 putative imidazolonepropionase-like protein [Blastocystis sp. subtype 4]|eukprot:XP_014525692.1 putative imidazolonepropionase-like protein [Blastocystis sp. subtype 4]
MQKSYRLIVRNAKQLVMITKNHEKMLCGKAMNNIEVVNNGSIVVDENGIIVAVGPAAEISEQFKDSHFEKEIDATGCCVVPGLVDAHTHPVFAGDRVNEYRMKLEGATYMDIHKIGGGIGFTVRHVHETGYGLVTEHEVKMLRVIQRAKKLVPLDIVINLLAAHSVPEGYTSEEATDMVVNEMIPTVIDLKKKGELDVELIDVSSAFCEKGIYNVEQTQRIMEEGKKHGLGINFHADELTALGGAEMGAKLGALGMSHLECISEEGVKLMAEHKSVAILLPTTAWIMHLTPPPARKMIEANVPVAVASDYNPNAYCMSMPFVMNLSCILMGMTMNEALVAGTLNAAASIGHSDMYGSLEVGKYGDMLILDAPQWEHLFYRIGDEPIRQVIKKGVIIEM